MQPGELIEVGSELGAEFGEGGRTSEGLIHAKAHNDDLSGPLSEERFEMFFVTFGPEAVADFIPGPGEAAKAQAFFGVSQLDKRFEFPMLVQAFDHGIAIEQNGVTGLKIDFGEGGRGGGAG